MRQTINTSGMKTLIACPRKYLYAYIYGLRPELDAPALSIGTAVHEGLAAWRQGATVIPETEPADVYDAAMARGLLKAYYVHYAADTLAYVATEKPFKTRFQKYSHLSVYGTVDALAMMDDRFYIIETKTAGEDISPDAPYWLRLRNDQQIHCYSWAFPQAYGVIYDVIRKPAIRVSAIPTLDDDGLKIVYDATGQRAMNQNGKPRQTGGEGYIVLSRPETPQEFEERVTTIMLSAPDEYFQRREVPVLSDGIEAWQRDVAATADMLRFYKRKQYYPRHVGRWTCGQCAYSSFCLQNQTINPACPPAGYKIEAKNN